MGGPGSGRRKGGSGGKNKSFESKLKKDQMKAEKKYSSYNTAKNRKINSLTGEKRK